MGSVSLESRWVCVRIDLLADGDPLERFARGRGVELDERNAFLATALVCTTRHQIYCRFTISFVTFFPTEIHSRGSREVGE